MKKPKARVIPPLDANASREAILMHRIEHLEPDMGILGKMMAQILLAIRELLTDDVKPIGCWTDDEIIHYVRTKNTPKI
jgi:hypothetical protein